MMEEGVEVEAFYVCVKFTLICRGVHQDSLMHKIYTYVTGLARFKCFQRDLSVNFTQN